MEGKATTLTFLLVLHGILAIAAAPEKAIRTSGRADIDLGPVDYECPAGDYIAPHELHCELYYICAAGATPTHLYHCVDDQLFDLNYYGCNFKELVDCGDRLKPFTCPTPDGQFPVKENACDSRYYVCVNNNATLTYCPIGEIYQQSSQTCVTPEAADCPTTTTLRTTRPTVTTIPPTSGPFECPKPDGSFPSPYSCSQYYVCVDGTPSLYDCPSGLYYNPAIDQCDWPSNVPCNIPK